MADKHRVRVGIEVGGTFTDLVVFDGRELRVAKVSSTPACPEEGAFDALSAARIPCADVADLVHGSTVATNAVLERRGAHIAFVTTAGFRDLLFLQRHDRRTVYDLAYQRPVPLVARQDCFEVAERVLPDGSVVLPLDAAQVAAALLPSLRKGGYDAVAICLLNAYANPAHEEQLAQLIERLAPGLFVTTSNRVVCEFREYERASTTAMAAYVQPVIDRYLARFQARLHAERFAGLFTVMQSNGGRLPAQAMRLNAVTAMYSGPAAGVVGAVHQIGLSGWRNLITFDMGGTSTDVSLVEDGRPTLTASSEVAGLPIRTPVLDIVTVGAGGGSIVEIDAGGMLQVGPRSAGAQPGPACYGRGGRLPTVTDAHVLRGTLQPDMFLGGQMPLDRSAAEQAFAPLAARFDSTPIEMADHALRLADASIVRAIQLVSTERGRDPRDFVLAPYGGAGPLHAATVAQDLGITTIVVPPNPGAMSAYGLLAAPIMRFATRTLNIPLDDGARERIAAAFEVMRAALAQALQAMGLPETPDWSLTLEMRFKGQAFEVSVDIDAAQLRQLGREALEQAFLAAYQKVYMQRVQEGRAIEIVALRVGAAIAPGEVPVLNEAPQAAGESVRTIFMDGNATPATFVPVDTLPFDVVRAGPLVLQSNTSSILVPAGWSAQRDRHQNIVLTKDLA